MRKPFIIAAALSVGILVSAQCKLDLTSRAQLRLERLSQSGLTGSDRGRRLLSVSKKTDSPEKYVLCLTTVSDENGFTDLEQAGAIIHRTRGNIGIVSLPVEKAEEISSLDCVTRMQLSHSLHTSMDKARAASGVDLIHNGENLSQTYTGRGVIAGIVDGGMDPNHINFRNTDGSSRIGYLGHLRVSTTGDQLLETHYGADNIASFSTDDRTTFHGTHTMGILAGGYRGNLDVAVAQPDGTTVTENKPNPYYGVACDAEIAAACGTLVDAVIAYGVDYILDYAYRNDKRAVINLSLGSNLGPHDGTDVIHRYFDAVAEQDNAIICISSGNEGDLPLSLHKTMNSDNTRISTFIRPYVYTDMRYGQVEIYSDDDTEFTFKAVIFNKSRGRISYEMPIVGNTGGEAVYWVSSDDYMASANDIKHKNFSDVFEGYVGLATTTDPVTGRYYASMSYYTVDTDKNSDGNYILGFVVEGNDGQRIDCFCDGEYTALDSYDIAGWDNGSADGTINDMACAKSTIAVGSYNTRDNWPSLDGYVYGYNGTFPAGEITYFSSYGTLIDGRTLPHVCAPGAAIISSTSSYFVTASSLSPSYLHAELKEGDRTNHWEQTSGTSMAAPYVAGSIATWLEADPTLSADDVKEIIAATATRDNDVLTTGSPAQWGAGKFNAYEGLKEVLRRAHDGIEGVTADDSRRTVITPAGHRQYRIFLGGASSLDIRATDLTGKTVAAITTAGDEVVLDMSGVSCGVYIISVNGSFSERILIK